MVCAANTMPLIFIILISPISEAPKLPLKRHSFLSEAQIISVCEAAQPVTVEASELEVLGNLKEIKRSENEQISR